MGKLKGFKELVRRLKAIIIAFAQKWTIASIRGSRRNYFVKNEPGKEIRFWEDSS